MPKAYRNCFLVILAVLLGAQMPVSAELSSPQLDRLQLEIAPYVLPSEVGAKIIPVVNLDGVTFETFSEVLEPHGVTLVTSQSLREVKLNISLRNLSINRVMQFVTHQVNAQWFYHEGRVIIFSSTNELNEDFKKIFAEKEKLDKQISIERKRLGKIQAEAKDSALRQSFVDEFSVSELTLSETIKELSKASAKTGYAEGKGVNIIPLFNPKSYQETHSYAFRNKSIAEILDTLCADSKMMWRVGQHAVTISPE